MFLCVIISVIVVVDLLDRQRYITQQATTYQNLILQLLHRHSEISSVLKIPKYYWLTVSAMTNLAES